jgi:DNA-directed RNA polymerase specialized sigma24 family protein
MEASVSEEEHERLHRALKRLSDGHREALGIIDQGLEDLESSAQESLAEVQDILSGALEDARDILDGGEGSEV